MERVREIFAARKADGTLFYFPSDIVKVPDNGLIFQFRICPTLLKKDKSDKDQYARPVDSSTGLPHNPFLPYEAGMEVFSLPRRTDHVLLLNKFALVPNHLLVISRHYEAQLSWLTLENFEATLEAMKMLEEDGTSWLAFYNCGRDAGSSQHHRHFQLLPFEDGAKIPVEAVLPEEVGPSKINAFSSFHHHFIRLDNELTAESLFTFYQDAIEAFPSGSSGAHNVLFTSEWMLVVPRRSEYSSGVPMNSLAFAGCLLMRGEEQFEDWLEAVGSPIKGLEQLTFPTS